MAKLNLGILTVIVLAIATSCSSKYTIKPRTSEQIVTDSAVVLQTILARQDLKYVKNLLADAAGCAIFPSLYKAGFFFGAEGGNGILIARDENGNWGYPGFYTLVGGSWGLQFGGQKAGVLLILRSREAVKAILNHQGKLGGDVGMAIGPIGAGLEGSITTNLAADIYAFSEAKGLFGGVAIKGAAMVRRNDLNKRYYGITSDANTIVLGKALKNVHADILRSKLTGE